MLYKKDAERIAAKLKAEIIPGRAHQWAVYTVDDEEGRFSIRHGRRSDHHHLVNDLGLSARKLQQFAACDISVTEFAEQSRHHTRKPNRTDGEGV